MNGNAYYWGQTSKVIQWKPKKMFVNNVKTLQKIESQNECIVLEESGKVFIYELEQGLIYEIVLDVQVIDLFYDYHAYLFEISEGIQKFDVETKVSTKLNHANFYDYYSSENNITYKTIHVKSETNDGQEVKYLTIKEIQLNPEYNRQPNEDLLVLIDKNISDKKFQNKYHVIKSIDQGTYGQVFKVGERETGCLFAIKKIQMKGKLIFFYLK